MFYESVQPLVFVFRCHVTKYCKLKQHLFTGSQFCRLEVWAWWLGSLLRVLRLKSRVGWAVFLSGGFEEEFASMLNQVISHFQFLVFVGLKVLFPCRLSAGGHWLPRGHPLSLPHDPTRPSQSQQDNVPCAKSLSHIPCL